MQAKNNNEPGKQIVGQESIFISYITDTFNIYHKRRQFQQAERFDLK